MELNGLNRGQKRLRRKKEAVFSSIKEEIETRNRLILTGVFYRGRNTKGFSIDGQSN